MDWHTDQAQGKRGVKTSELGSVRNRSPSRKGKSSGSIGVDGGSCQLVEGLPADLASAGLRGVWEEPEEPVGTLVDTPFYFQICVFYYCAHPGSEVSLPYS